MRHVYIYIYKEGDRLPTISQILAKCAANGLPIVLEDLPHGGSGFSCWQMLMVFPFCVFNATVLVD